MKAINSIPYKTIRSANKNVIHFANINEKDNLIYVSFVSNKNGWIKIYKFLFNDFNENAVYENVPLSRIHRIKKQ